MYPGSPTNHSPEIYSAILGFVFSTDRIYEKEQNIQDLEANIQWELINSSYKAQNEFNLKLARACELSSLSLGTSDSGKNFSAFKCFPIGPIK